MFFFFSFLHRTSYSPNLSVVKTNVNYHNSTRVSVTPTHRSLPRSFCVRVPHLISITLVRFQVLELLKQVPISLKKKKLKYIYDLKINSTEKERRRVILANFVKVMV